MSGGEAQAGGLVSRGEAVVWVVLGARRSHGRYLYQPGEFLQNVNREEKCEITHLQQVNGIPTALEPNGW